MKGDTKARAIIGAGKEENRIKADFYPTPPVCTAALLDFLKLKPSIIWEPACGDGAISKVLEAQGHTVYSSDLSDRGYPSLVEDYLSAEPFIDFDAIITNPPFSLAQAFIEKALNEAPLVAMLLKNQYWHAKARQDLFKSKPPAYVLPLTWRPNFFGDQATGASTMDFIWCVWIKDQTDTRYRPLNKPKL